MRVRAWLLAAREHDGADQERQDGEAEVIAAGGSVQLGAQTLELGGIDGFDVGDVRDLTPGRAEAFGDASAEPEHRFVAGRGRSVMVGGGRLGRGGAGDASVEIAVQHAAFRAGAGDGPEIEAEGDGPRTNRRSGEGLAGAPF